MLQHVPPELRKKWPRDVGSCVAGAAQACLGLGLGTWIPERWEIELDGQVDTSQTTGKFRRNSPPNRKTVESIKARLPDSDIEYWVHLPLWYLLTEETVSPLAVRYALDWLYGDLRGLIWSYSVSPMRWTGEFRMEVTPRTIEGFHRHETVQSFVGLIALAREAMVRRELRCMYLSAEVVRDMFVRVVSKTPHLYIRWPTLMRLLKERVWTPPGGIHVSHPWPEINFEGIEQAMNGVAGMPPARIVR